MATFDIARLDMDGPSRYYFKNPTHTVSFQQMVEDFMHVVRVNPGFFLDKLKAFKRFMSLINRDEAWPLCALVVPEFRIPQ
jgi:hypothetical protein